MRFATPVSDFDIEAGDLIENTELVAMGSFEMQKGRFGAFADVIYMDVGDSIDDATIETQMIESSKVLDDKTRHAIDRENALALFPRLARTAAAA